ncbi:hypothetical protein HDK77DRAFT_486861 [Phyllosticta capitalensis]|uniref:uncharacterized protein n=1 Tax=Phyllosticta capitalensis TaxID=121624 RepID=UPI00312CD762
MPNSSSDAQQPLLDTSRTLTSFGDQAFGRVPSASSETEIGRSRQTTQRFLSSKTGHYAVLLLVGLDVSCIFADFVIRLFLCEKRLPYAWNDALEALGIVSLVFSCLFMVELAASLWAFGLEYLKKPFHVFDAVIILTSFILDILLRGVIEEVASMIIILRAWRLIKIVEELSVGAQEQTEDLEARIQTLEDENRRLRTENQRLKSR